MSLEGRKPQVIPGVLKLYVKIPLERIKLLTTNKMQVIKELESRTLTKVSLDEVNCFAIIEPSNPSTPVVNVMKARDFINAVAAGFSPDKAWRLLNDEQILVIIDLKSVVGESQNHLTRIKGRVIGEEGKVKKNIEEITGTDISVYDDNIAIIGDYESANLAREAVEMLIQGRQHSTVYKYLDRAVRDVKKRKVTAIWSKE
ncbi:MAG: KH domain-containing protein [Sulfolobales archaeon]|nr:KH domain-containing protein [Sulfolobales archaeon]